MSVRWEDLLLPGKLSSYQDLMGVLPSVKQGKVSSGTYIQGTYCSHIDEH